MFGSLVFSTASVQTSSNRKEAQSNAASFALASTYTTSTTTEESEEDNSGVFGYDRNTTSANPNQATDVLPGSSTSQVYALDLVNSIFHSADNGDGKLTADELEAYINSGSLSSAERAAAKFLQSHYTTVGAEDGDASNITLGDLGNTEKKEDDGGLSDKDVASNPFSLEQGEEEADEADTDQA